MLPRFVVCILFIGLIVAGMGLVSGQDPSTGLRTGYPKKPIRIVANQVGGGGDFTARLIAQEISGPLGEPVIVENRPSNLTGEIVSKASPDGYTLLLAGGTFLIGPLLEKTPYNPVRDFSPITLTDKSLNVLVVYPSVSANTVKELIALAKAKPGALNYASSGSGGTFHLAAELFKSMAGVNIVRIPYKGSGPALNDLIGGQVQVAFGTASLVAPHLKSGKLRALAVTSAEPSALFPGLPTVAASLPGYEAVSLQGMFVPAKTSEVIIKRLNREIVRVLSRADVKEKFLKTGVETVSSSPEEIAAMIKSELAKWGKVIKDAGIRIE